MYGNLLRDKRFCFGMQFNSAIFDVLSDKSKSRPSLV